MMLLGLLAVLLALPFFVWRRAKHLPSYKSASRAPLMGIAVSIAVILVSFGLCGVTSTHSDRLIQVGQAIFSPAMTGLVACSIWLAVVMMRSNR